MNQEARYTMRLADEEVEISRVPSKPLGELKFDPRNQRIQFHLKLKGKDPRTVTQEEVYQIFWKEERVHLNKLYHGIYEHGGLIHPLVVQADGTVMEGNCRLAALIKLCKDYAEDGKFCSAPCEILPAGLTEEQRGLYMGEAHVAGKQEWDAYEQAEHLWRMNKELGKSEDFLSKHLRMSKLTVGRRIAAYQMTKDFLEKYPKPENIYKFSYFEEFEKQKRLRARREEDPGFTEKFFRWVAEGNIPRGERVRELPELIEDREVEDTLDQRGWDAAMRLKQTKNPETRLEAYRAIDDAILGLDRLPISEIERLRNGHSAEAEKLRALYSRLKQIANLAGLELS